MFLKLALGLVSISVVQIGLSGLAPVSAAPSDLYNPHQNTGLNCSETDQCTLMGSRSLEWEAPTAKKIPEPGMVTAVLFSGVGILSSQKRRPVADK